ncbi:MAG: dihydroorotate dehydrogenase [Bacillota bacterium]
MTEVNLAVDVAGITMDNPVTTASGTYGFGLDYSRYYDVNLLGALTLKSITLEKREGNPPPRIIETPAGILNSIGLANPGLDRFLTEVIPSLEAVKIPVLASIAGDTMGDYALLAERLSQEPKIAGLEVNISCPNVKKGGLEFGVDTVQVKKLVQAVRSSTDLPLIIKLSPNVTDITAIARSAVEGGADALALINTLQGMKIDIHTRKPCMANKVAGLAGPAVKPIGVRMVWQVAQAVNVPIIGMGGICTTEDALEYIMAGATSVAVGTCNFVNPMAPVEIIQGLYDYCINKGIKDINELVGCSFKRMLRGKNVGSKR